MPTILVVDDSASDRVRVSGIAAKWQDSTVLQAENGRAALLQIETHLPEMVLTDLHMPEMNGLELVEAVRNDFPNIPVVLMTAQGSEEIAAEALRVGAASYVPKMRLADDLITTMTQVYSSVQASQDDSRLMHYLSVGQMEFTLPNDRGVLRSCSDQISNMLRCLPLGDEAEQLRVTIAIQEALDNAYYHGNLEVKTGADGDVSKYDEIARSRLYEDPYVHRRINVKAHIDRDSFTLTIRDGGTGFANDLLPLPGQLKASGARSRGLRLIYSAMDEVTFNDSHNEIRLVKHAATVDDDDFSDDDLSE